MELDKRVGEYAAAIVRDADLLLADAANLNEEQQQEAVWLKKAAVQFQSLYAVALPHFAQLNDEGRMIAHDLRRPLTNIEGYCDLLLTIDNHNLTETQTKLLHQIDTAHDFIRNAFTSWVNSEHETGNQKTNTFG